ncbi:MAG: hypothetical protein N2444_00090 [Methylocystis sp.]|nr:hypothetical protein [Methylocystis sp.]
MTQYSDAAQKAAIDAAIRCIRFNERPRAAEREMLVAQLEFIRRRIEKSEEARRAVARGRDGERP